MRGNDRGRTNEVEEEEEKEEKEEEENEDEWIESGGKEERDNLREKEVSFVLLYEANQRLKSSFAVCISPEGDGKSFILYFSR